MKTLFIILFLFTGIVINPIFGRAQGLLLDDFEGVISAVPGSTVNVEVGGGASVEIAASTDIKYSGNQSLKLTYIIPPPAYSDIRINKGLDFGPNTHWLVEPEDINWGKFNAIAFYMYGRDSKAKFTFDITDAGFERWRFIFEDNFIGWKQVVCPFSKFQIKEFQANDDWQIGNPDKNTHLDFPLRDFQIKIVVDDKIKTGSLYLDKIELLATGTATGRAQSLLLDDFEGVISAGPESTVNAEARGGSSVEIAASTDLKYSGHQSLKITYKAVPPNYSYVKVSAGLDYPNAHWLVEPENIEWDKFNAIALYMYGSNSKTRFTFNIIDAGHEIWHFIFEDNFIGWKQVVCPFNEFRFGDIWKVDKADKNSKLDFPISDFQIESLPNGKIEEGTVYFDKVELIKM
ncbi:MAG: carbohydrate binding domain-containing protein [Candidatus Omnitrophota bacterium]